MFWQCRSLLCYNDQRLRVLQIVFEQMIAFELSRAKIILELKPRLWFSVYSGFFEEILVLNILKKMPHQYQYTHTPLFKAMF